MFGLDVRTDGPRIREKVGYMPEHDVLPPDVSATDLVTHLAEMSGLPRTAARERAAEVFRHVGLFEERYRPIGGYSTGMKQRVKLAQALVHDPRLLLLDEPTNGLDPAGRDEMLDLVRRTGTEFGMAVVLSSHLLGEIERVCDHVVAIDTGRLLRDASLASFTSRTGTLVVELDEGAADVVADLVAAGVAALQDGPRRVLVPVADERPFDLVRDAGRGARPGADAPRAGPPPGRGPVPGHERRRLPWRRRLTSSPAPPPAASTTWATGATTARAWADVTPSRRSSCTACAPSSGWDAAAGRRSRR